MGKPKPQELIPVHHVLPVILSNQMRATIDGHTVSVKGARLRTYALHGCKCVHCGIEGKVFSVKPNGGSYKKPHGHLNLFAFDPMGNPVLMTSDHIWPVSKGGPHGTPNRQPLCVNCNSKKNDRLPNAEELETLARNGVDLKALITKYKNKKDPWRTSNWAIGSMV